MTEREIGEGKRARSPSPLALATLAIQVGKSGPATSGVLNVIMFYIADEPTKVNP